MEQIGLAQLAGAPLQEAEVYVARAGGLVRLRELTGQAVFMASRLALAPVAGTEDLQRVDVAKREALRILFALVDPALDADLTKRAAQVQTILSLGYADQLLLSRVIDLLSEGTLTEQQRELLKQPLPPGELLRLLGTSLETTEEYLQTRGEDDLRDILAVALCGYGGALTGEMSMGLVRLLAAARREAEARQARLTAEALAGLIASP